MFRVQWPFFRVCWTDVNEILIITIVSGFYDVCTSIDMFSLRFTTFFVDVLPQSYQAYCNRLYVSHEVQKDRTTEPLLHAAYDKLVSLCTQNIKQNAAMKKSYPRGSSQADLVILL